MDNLPVGKRVLMCGDHPWTGHSGEIVRWAQTPFGTRPVVRLDNGMECLAIEPSHIKALGARGRR